MREEFMITRQGKQYVLFAGLLDEAHAQGLKSIDTELLQIPTEGTAQTAICKAIVVIEKADPNTGELVQAVFSGIGDASPENVSRNILPHTIRMAETRAKARALRDAVNIGATALEELSSAEDDESSYARAASASGRSRSTGDRTPRQGTSAPAARSGSSGRPRGASGRPVTAVPDSGTGPASNSNPEEPKARKSQIDLLRTLAEELRGENGVERLEGRIGKPLADLNRKEADEWIDRLTPAERASQ